MHGADDNAPHPITPGSAVPCAIEETIDGDASARGASMVEYALLLVLVLLVAFFSLQVFGETLVAVFDTSANSLQNAPKVAAGS